MGPDQEQEDKVWKPDMRNGTGTDRIRDGKGWDDTRRDETRQNETRRNGTRRDGKGRDGTGRDGAGRDQNGTEWDHDENETGL